MEDDSMPALFPLVGRGKELVREQSWVQGVDATSQF